MSLDTLTYIHLLTAPLLLLPVLALTLPHADPPAEIPGIRPITIRVITPRRTIVLVLLSLLAITSLGDVAILIADFLTARSRDEGSVIPSHGVELVSAILYCAGEFIIWSLAGIVAEWRQRWGDKPMVFLGLTGMVFEILNLGFLIVALGHSLGWTKLFYILSIIASSLRSLLLPCLMVAAAAPIIKYEHPDETTGLLNGHHSGEDGDPSTPTPHGREARAYGTFPSGEPPSGMGKPSPSATPGTGTGAATPATIKPGLVIPKKLGEIKKEEKPLQWREVAKRIGKLSPYLWPSASKKLQSLCVACVLLLIIGRVLLPVQPLMLGQIVRSLTSIHAGTGGANPWPPFITYFIIRVSTGSGILGFLQQRLWIPVSQNTDREMQLLCFNHLLDLSLAYHTKRNTGEVMRIIDRGSAINNLFQTVLFTAAPTFLDIGIAFGVFFYLYGGLLATVTLAVMLAYIFVSVNMTSRRAPIRRQLMDRDVKQRGIVSDVLANWESVKYFTAEGRETSRYREAILSYQETESRWNIEVNLFSLIQTFLLAVGLLCGALIVSHRVMDGTADAAEFVVFIQYFGQLSSPLSQLAYLYRSLNQNSTDAEKMFNLLAEATEVNDKPGATELVVTDGIIEFDNVRFSYDTKVEALKGVSFRIGKGQSMALVGESGSGKSTILRLLYRFYDIDSGRILIDGQDISKVTQLSLRQAIGIVPQDSVLWNDSIGANISYGKVGASDEEIIEAAQAAKLHTRILGFPEQYSTVVGERGVRLSGGEQQRVSLARMFLKSPAILVLDEATSALDTETEREIQRALADLARDRSSLSVAHRLSTIINSDQIVVMKDGQVVENGSYKELLELDGAFAGMWKKQIHTEAEMVIEAGARDGKRFNAEMEEVEDEKDRNPGGDAAAEETDGAQDGGSSASGEMPVQATDPVSEEVKDSARTDGSLSTGLNNGDLVAEPAVEEVLRENDTTVSGEALHAAGPNSEHTHSSPVTEEEPTRSEGPNEQEATVPQPPTGTGTPQHEPHSASKPFPDMPRNPRLSTSGSQHSDLSATSERSTPEPTEAPSIGVESKKEKQRKTLSSLKGLVRRISDRADQGLTRSPSLGRPGSNSMGEVDEGTAQAGAATSNASEDKKKKRLSVNRTRSDK